jgi:hypothetical protein
MTPANLQEAAEMYVSQGLVLVPIPHGRKKPVINEWQKHGVDSLEQARAVFKIPHNMGLLHGESGTCCLDIDDESAAHEVFEAIGLNLDGYLNARTPKIKGARGTKPVFKMPKGITLGIKKLAWRDVEGKPHNVFELRGAGGQDVLPPSLHPDGIHYEWLDGYPESYDDFLELPSELLNLWQKWEFYAPIMQSVSPYFKAPKIERKANTETSDIIERYNQSVDIAGLLESYSYKRKGKKFVAPNSSTGLAGVVILESDGKQVVYSHHGSDVLGDGHSHDAFAVMQLLECNGDIKQALDKARERLGMPAFTPKQQSSNQALTLDGEASVTWEDIQPLPDERPTAPTLPPEMLPDVLRGWLTDVASRACLPLEMLAAPALVALSGLIGRSVTIKPLKFSDWSVTPNLWGGVVAPPGSMKSDAISEAFRPLSKLEQKAREDHDKAKLEAEVEKMELEAQLSAAKGKAKRGKSPQGELKSIITKLREVEAIPEKRYTTQDVTVEKLGELLRDNPRGLTVLRDELASWIASLEAEDNATARGFFLTAWNGSSGYTFDRIGRGTTYIPAACVSVFGGIQPKPLDAVFNRLRSDPTRADGMLQRFQVMVYPDGLPQWHSPTSWGDRTVRDRAYKVFERLDVLELGDEPVNLTFSPDSQTLFCEWHDTLEHRLRSGDLDKHPHFASHLAKYRSLAPSLAVVFHLVNLVGLETFTAWGSIPPVNLEALSLALDWCDFLEIHARKIYSAEINLEAVAAHALAKKIQEGKVTDGMTVRDIRRNQWAGLTGDALDIAISKLERLNWVKVTQSRDGDTPGRSSEVLMLHPEARRGGK